MNEENTPPPPPAPEPKTSPEPEKTAAASAPAIPFIQIAKAFFDNRQPAVARRAPDAPRWLTILAMIFRLVWPLAMLGGGIALFCVIGANGWLWLVLALLAVCGIFARPPKDPRE